MYICSNCLIIPVASPMVVTFSMTLEPNVRCSSYFISSLKVTKENNRGTENYDLKIQKLVLRRQEGKLRLD